MVPPPVSTGQQQHAPPAAPVEAPKRPSPTAQSDEQKELEDEVARLLKVQQDFIVQQRKEQAEWQKRLDELKAAPIARIDQPKEQTAAYEEFLMQKIRAIWTEEDRRQQADASTARPAQKTKETRAKKTAEQKRQRAKKPPIAQPGEQTKTAVEETVARAKAQGDLLFERLRKMQDELQQQADAPNAQQTVQEANKAPIQPPTNKQKQRSLEAASTARPEQKSEGTVALRKRNQDLLMHIQMPTSQLQQQADEDGATDETPSDMRAKIQQQLERFLSQQPAVEVVACWVENPDGTTVPIAPAAPSTPTAGVEEEPRPSTSKEPESPAYSIVNLLDSEDETGWTDADDVEVIDSDYH
ncbi:hypothetical protein M3Y99_01843900 [Aphelenchoides fujianensis]|nr:hypothetical protein M3Y99_01843900 [Aphelenchoides fujianensis]